MQSKYDLAVALQHYKQVWFCGQWFYCRIW